MTRFATPRVRLYRRVVVVFGLGLLAGVLAAQENAADNTNVRLQDGMKQLATDIKTYLTTDARDTSIAMGSFTGPPQLAASAGTAIKKMLVDELEKQQITVSRTARLGCKGEYFLDDNDPSVQVKVDIVDGSRRRKTYERKIHEVGDFLALLGGTGSLSLDPAKRKEDIKNAVTNPQPETLSKAEVAKTTGTTPGQPANVNPPTNPNPANPNPANPNPPANPGQPPAGKPAGQLIDPNQKVRVLASKESKYGVELWTKASGGAYQPQPVANENGLIFVNLNLEDVYAVRLINATKFPAAVTLTIDGLNMFTFSENPDYKALGKVLIPSNPEGFLIKGWHINDQFSAEFHVTELANSEAVKFKDAQGKLRLDEEIGTITATFHVAVPPGTEPPADGELFRNLGTKRGPLVESKFQAIPVKIGAAREVVSIRYSRPLPP